MEPAGNSGFFIGACPRELYNSSKSSTFGGWFGSNRSPKKL